MAILLADGMAVALVLHPIMATLLGILVVVVVLPIFELAVSHLQTEWLSQQAEAEKVEVRIILEQALAVEPEVALLVKWVAPRILVLPLGDKAVQAEPKLLAAAVAHPGLALLPEGLPEHLAQEAWEASGKRHLAAAAAAVTLAAAAAETMVVAQVQMAAAEAVAARVFTQLAVLVRKVSRQEMDK